jgi:hypothetical protein
LDALSQDDDVVDSVEAQLLLRETYQTVMGIYSHVTRHKEPRPMALFAAHPNESTKETSRRFRRMHQFSEAKVMDIFGVSWDKFQEMPFPEAELLLSVARDRNRIDAENQAGGIPKLPMGIDKK